MKMKYGNTLPDMVLLRKWKSSHTEEGSAKGEFWSDEDTWLYRTGGLFGSYFRNIQPLHLKRQSDVKGKNSLNHKHIYWYHNDSSYLDNRPWFIFEVQMKNVTL